MKKSTKTAAKKTTKKAATPKASGKAKATAPKRISALDAAATVLRQKGAAMGCAELILAMAEAGLWVSPKGKTPAGTLNAAIAREIANKGKDSRFTKAGPGKFEAV